MQILRNGLVSGSALTDFIVPLPTEKIRFEAEFSKQRLCLYVERPRAQLGFGKSVRRRYRERFLEQRTGNAPSSTAGGDGYVVNFAPTA